MKPIVKILVALIITIIFSILMGLFISKIFTIRFPSIWIILLMNAAVASISMLITNLIDSFFKDE